MSYSIPLTVELLNVLVSHNADLNYNLLLQQAVFNDNFEISKRLVELGANPEIFHYYFQR